MTAIDLPADLPSVQRIEVHTLDPEKANICVVTLHDVVPMVQTERLRHELKALLEPLGVKVVLVTDERASVEFKEVPGEGNV